MTSSGILQVHSQTGIPDTLVCIVVAFYIYCSSNGQGASKHGRPALLCVPVTSFLVVSVGLNMSGEIQRPHTDLAW